MKKIFRSVIVASLLAFAALSSTAYANHSWGGYHWARTANPFVLVLGNNLTPDWNPYLTTSASDWSSSTVLDLGIVPSTKGKTCKPTLGRVEVCNSTYGRNGWLGIASISANGTHITQATVKMNDTYFSGAQYNTPAWKQLVMCQEIGHTFGLDHQDIINTNPNLGTCMDYTNDPSTNQHPNQHDYDMLETIYAHLDSITTISAATVARVAYDTEDPKEWGTEIGKSKAGKSNLYERDLGHGNKVFTFVTWAE